MKRRLSIIGLGLAVFFLSGCAMAAAPVNGTLYSHVVGPVNATSVPKATRTGKACSATYLGWVALGEGGIENAKREGGISEVASVDSESFSVLGLYARFCTVVTGN